MGALTDLDQGDKGKVIEAIVTDSISAERPKSRQKPLLGAYGALLLFMFIYSARPEDWIPGLLNVPLAKIAAILAVLALVFSLRQIRQRFAREVVYLAILVGQLFLAALLSPVWRGGAVQATLTFSKVLIIVIVMTVAVNSAKRLRLMILVQAASVALIAVVTIVKGHLLVGRLEGTLGGIYSNPNDLALAITIALPLCLALLFLAKNRVWSVTWALALLVMLYAVFRTGSRAGFLGLIAAAVVCLWEFAIRGRRRYLILLAVLLGVILWQSASGMLAGRLKGTLDIKEDTASAYGSAQQRQQLFWRSIEITAQHPLFGVGPGNFEQVSGSWLVTHNSFTQMSSEGGVPAFILYVLILLLGFRNARAAKQLTKGTGELSVLAKALQASLVAYMIGSLFASTAYQFFPYFLVAYTTALFLIAKKSVFHSKEHESASQAAPEKQVYADTTNAEMLWHSI